MFRLQPDANNRNGSISQVGTFKTPQDRSATTPNVGFTSTAVMYDPAASCRWAATASPTTTPTWPANRPPSSTSTARAPVLTETAPMANRRHWANANVLPGGQVVVTGGSTIGWQNANAVRAAEIWDPATRPLDAGRQQRHQPHLPLVVHPADQRHRADRRRRRARRRQQPERRGLLPAAAVPPVNGRRSWRGGPVLQAISTLKGDLRRYGWACAWTGHAAGAGEPGGAGLHHARLQHLATPRAAHLHPGRQHHQRQPAGQRQPGAAGLLHGVCHRRARRAFARHHHRPGQRGGARHTGCHRPAGQRRGLRRRRRHLQPARRRAGFGVLRQRHTLGGAHRLPGRRGLQQRHLRRAGCRPGQGLQLRAGNHQRTAATGGHAQRGGGHAHHLHRTGHAGRHLQLELW
jgi:hypothetical protein